MITRSAFLFLACLIALAGCSKSEFAPASGKVTYNGEPLKFGGIMFQSETGHPSRGIIQADGTFELSTDKKPGAKIGENRVRITCYENQDPSLERGSDEPTLGKLLIPKKYTRLNTSGLEFTVPPEGKTDFLIELTDEN